MNYTKQARLLNFYRLLQPKFKLYRTYFFKVRKVYEKVKREQHLKKDRSSKGGRFWNIKTLTQQTKRRLLLRCPLPYSIYKHQTFAKKTPEGVAGVWEKGSRGIPLQADKETFKRGLYLCLLF